MATSMFASPVRPRRSTNEAARADTRVMLANASIQNVTTLQSLPPRDGFLAQLAGSSCPHGWITAFAAMAFTHLTIAGMERLYPGPRAQSPTPLTLPLPAK